jgi:membrane protease YdiL (CAAX protease family)
MPRPGLSEVRASVTVIMLFMVAAFFARSWLQIHLTQSGYASALARDLSFFVVLPITAVLMWPIMRENVAAMRHWFRPPAFWCRLIAYSVLFGLLLRITYRAGLTAGVAFGWLYSSDFPTVATAQFWFSCPAPQALALALLVRAVLTPLLEEFIHRGFIFHALLPRGNALAIILSAAFFGVMHNPQTIIIAFLIGLLLALLTLNLRTLWGPIIAHATYNLAAIVDWDCLHASWNPAATTPRLALIGGVALLTTLFGIASLIWLVRSGKTGTLVRPGPEPSLIN